MASNFTVILDACVLYPFALRDLLAQLATTELFLARWTDDIHDEWINAVVRQNPHITRDRLERTRQLMDLHVGESLVTGYRELIDGLVLPDPDDRHVLAATIRCSAQVIVTKNLKDFPAQALARYGMEAQHLDDFICGLLDLNAGLVVASVRRCRGYLKQPPKSVAEYLELLERQELVETVAWPRRYAGSL